MLLKAINNAADTDNNAQFCAQFFLAPIFESHTSDPIRSLILEYLFRDLVKN